LISSEEKLWEQFKNFHNLSLIVSGIGNESQQSPGWNNHGSATLAAVGLETACVDCVSLCTNANWTLHRYFYALRVIYNAINWFLTLIALGVTKIFNFIQLRSKVHIWLNDLPDIFWCNPQHWACHYRGQEQLTNHMS
jgi:hypothetical protein